MSKWTVYYLRYLELVGFLDGEEEAPLMFKSMDPRSCRN